MHTFEVSAVPLSSEPLVPMARDAAVGFRLGACSPAPSGPARRRRRRLAGSFEACGCNLPNLVECAPSAEDDEAPGDVGNDLHPFIAAVHCAFAKHHPLVLSPDDVWLCIAQGFVAHVDENAEALRGRFVRHEGKEAMKIRRDEFVKGSSDNDWTGCFAEFSDRIADRVGKKRDLVVADFSTTGAVEKAASEVVLMAAMRHYFDFSVLTLCGIPRITLLGTVEDWKLIRRRAAMLAEFDLGAWVDALVPLLDELVAAASGRPDRELWRSFYKVNDGSGGPWVTGWINVLFPYVETETFDRATHATKQVRRWNDYVARWAKGLDADEGGGPGTGEFPGGLSTAPFTWEFPHEKFAMEFVAGFVGVSQDPETLGVRPAIGWAVRDAPA